MARFTTDDTALSCTIVLDSEDETIDLSQERLGDNLLDELALALFASAMAQSAPDGTPWAPLAERRHKVSRAPRSKPPGEPPALAHHLGIRTGAMLSLTRFMPGQRTIEKRTATWAYTHGGAGGLAYNKAHKFHTGAANQSPRPLIGWPPAVKHFITQVLTLS